MTVVLLARDLMIVSRIAVAAEHTGVSFTKIGDPADLPPLAEATLLLVDWSERAQDWGASIASWRDGALESAAPRIILFGPHVDLEAHAAARASGLGPMWARSKLVSELRDLIGTSAP